MAIVFITPFSLVIIMKIILAGLAVSTDNFIQIIETKHTQILQHCNFVQTSCRGCRQGDTVAASAIQEPHAF